MAEVSKEPQPVARWVKGRTELVKGVSPATAPPGKKSGSQFENKNVKNTNAGNISGKGK